LNTFELNSSENSLAVQKKNEHVHVAVYEPQAVDVISLDCLQDMLLALCSWSVVIPRWRWYADVAAVLANATQGVAELQDENIHGRA